MNKKIFAIINTIALVCMMFQPVMAEDITIEKWNITYAGSGAESIERENNYAGMIDNYYFDGAYALVVKYPDCVEDGRIVVENEMTEELAAGTYTMSFYARGSVSANYTTAGIGESFQYNINADNWTIESNIPGADTKNWKKYSKTIEYTGGSDKLCFIFRGWTNGWDIDCVSLTDESGKEYVQNPSFEEISETIVSEYESAAYDPVNLIATPISGGLAISWKNPSTKNLKSMELYDITSGETVLVGDEFDNTPEAYNTCKITKLSNSSVYQYKLHISYRDGTQTEYFTYGIPSANDKQFSPWGITISKTSEQGFSPMEYSIDTKEVYEGNASLKVVSNIKGGMGNVFALFTQKVAVEPGADYRLSFMAKAINNKADLKITNSWNLLDGNTKQEVTNFKGTYDWKEFRVDIKEASSNSINFFFNLGSAFDGIWFDNFSLVKIENDEAAGDNLIKSPGFEELYSQSNIGTVGGLSAAGGDEKLNISWKSASGASKIKIYQLMEEGFCPRGYIHPSFTSVTVENLLNDAEHSFAFACVDEFGKEGEASEVTANTIAPDFKISEPKLYSGKTEVEELSFGTYTVETKVRNNKIDEAVPVTQMAALYKGKILKKLVSSSAMAEKLEPGDISLTLKTTIEIPEENYKDYHIEVFVWDSKSGMKSLYDYKKIEQVQE